MVESIYDLSFSSLKEMDISHFKFQVLFLLKYSVSIARCIGLYNLTSKQILYSFFNLDYVVSYKNELYGS